MYQLGLEDVKRIEDKKIKNIRNLFKLKKESQAVKDRIVKDIRNLFENEVIFEHVGNFWSNNCNEFERNGVKNKTLSIKEQLNEIRKYLRKYIINNLRKSDP